MENLNGLYLVDRLSLPIQACRYAPSSQVRADLALPLPLARYRLTLPAHRCLTSFELARPSPPDSLD